MAGRPQDQIGSCRQEEEAGDRQEESVRPLAIDHRGLSFDGVVDPFAPTAEDLEPGRRHPGQGRQTSALQHRHPFYLPGSPFV